MHRSRRLRILALTAFRNEAERLPGLLRSLDAQVDGIIGLDDSSSDGSGELVARHRLTANVIRLDRGPGSTHDDALLHGTLIRAAWEHGADWLLGIDADERLDRRFRRRAERLLLSPDSRGAGAVALPLREMWAPRQFRVDGIWGQKRAVRLIASDPEHDFATGPLHSGWASLSARRGPIPVLDANLYHLRMMTPEARIERWTKYRHLDPDNAHQPIGYDYMLDESGLQLRTVRWRERYRT